MDGWGQIIGVGMSAAAGIAAVLITQAYTGRRWRREREEKDWAEALAMARVAADSSESALAKAIARQRLDALGINPEWVEAHRDPEAGLADQIFGKSEIDIGDLTTVADVVAAPLPAIDADLQAIVGVVRRLDDMFALARAEARPEDDIRVRIFLVMVVFCLVFGGLGLAAARLALI